MANAILDESDRFNWSSTLMCHAVSYPEVDLPLAERWRSATAGSGSDAGADAVSSPLQRLVRRQMVTNVHEIAHIAALMTPG